MIDHKPLMQGAFGNLPTKRPCVECPLRRDSKPGYLGGYAVDQYIEVLHGIADIACHLSPGFPLNRSEQRSCTGVAMYRANAHVTPLARNAQAAVDYVGPDRLMVFVSGLEFALHHKGQKGRKSDNMALRLVLKRMAPGTFRKLAADLCVAPNINAVMKALSAKGMQTSDVLAQYPDRKE